MNIYPNHCPNCMAPSLNRNGNIICSNVRCKTWKHRRKQMANIERVVELEIGLTSDNPIIIYCSDCNTTAAAAAAAAHAHAATAAARAAYCYPCNKWFSFQYEVGKWYFSDAPHWKETYTYKYIGAPDYWDWRTRVKKSKQGEQQ